MSILTKIASLIKFCVTTETMKDKTQFSTQRVRYMGKENDVTVISPYGFYSSAPVERCLGTVWLVQGQEQNRVGIFTDFDQRNAITDKNTPLKEGEIELLNTSTRSRIKFIEDGEVLVEMKVQGTGDTRSRMRLKPNGEILLENGVTGDTILMKNDNTIVMDTPLVIMTNDLYVQGDIRPQDGSNQDIRDIFNAHIHPDIDDVNPNGITGTPTTNQ